MPFILKVTSMRVLKYFHHLKQVSSRLSLASLISLCQKLLKSASCFCLRICQLMCFFCPLRIVLAIKLLFHSFYLSLFCHTCFLWLIAMDLGHRQLNDRIHHKCFFLHDPTPAAVIYLHSCGTNKNGWLPTEGHLPRVQCVSLSHSVCLPLLLCFLQRRMRSSGFFAYVSAALASVLHVKGHVAAGIVEFLH